MPALSMGYLMPNNSVTDVFTFASPRSAVGRFLPPREVVRHVFGDDAREVRRAFFHEGLDAFLRVGATPTRGNPTAFKFMRIHRVLHRLSLPEHLAHERDGDGRGVVHNFA